ncbi:unnamed protein product [Polarella glacialis]|uniref:Uncharacterized protein n=1 Tax=Polarella glacialis TaxID=89957 RepID=A0A813I2X6_POLGL|nr:unnamed protein product [Polarella glacialis]
MRDVSVEVEGPVAHDGHIFANWMWQFLSSMDGQLIGDGSLATMTIFEGNATKVQLSRFPDSVTRQAPQYEAKCSSDGQVAAGVAKMISLGHYGKMKIDSKPSNPSDAGIVGMLASARKSIRIAAQDMGPLCVPVSSS